MNLEQLQGAVKIQAMNQPQYRNYQSVKAGSPIGIGNVANPGGVSPSRPSNQALRYETLPNNLNPDDIMVIRTKQLQNSNKITIQGKKGNAEKSNQRLESGMLELPDRGIEANRVHTQ